MATKAVTTRERVESFYRYATEQLSSGGSEKSVDELFDEWRIKNPTSEEHAANVAAIQEALDDLAAGVEPIPYEEFAKDFRRRHGLDDD